MDALDLKKIKFQIFVNIHNKKMFVLTGTTKTKAWSIYTKPFTSICYIQVNVLNINIKNNIKKD